MADLAEIKRMIEEALPGAEVEVIDERRRRPPAREVRAAAVRGPLRIDQHRMVKAAVKERFDDGSIHALSVKTGPLPSPTARTSRVLRLPGVAGRSPFRTERP